MEFESKEVVEDGDMSKGLRSLYKAAPTGQIWDIRIIKINNNVELL